MALDWTAEGDSYPYAYIPRSKFSLRCMSSKVGATVTSFEVVKSMRSTIRSTRDLTDPVHAGLTFRLSVDTFRHDENEAFLICV